MNGPPTSNHSNSDGNPDGSAARAVSENDGDPDATIGQQLTQFDVPYQALSDQQFDCETTARPAIGSSSDTQSAGDTQLEPDHESTISSDLDRMITMQWTDSIVDEAMPHQTIKTDPDQTLVQSFDPVLKQREVSRQDTDPKGIPDYVREELLGEGGIGQVYAARQNSIDRQVAIKVLKTGAARRESSRLSFVSEAMITGELDHPNIVPVYDLGLDGGNTPFYVMKQVHGVEWADRMPESSLRENLNILMRVADAVALAHARGFIHRDLKPANVMLGEFGEVLVMDWGLAMPTLDNPKRMSFPKPRSGGTPCYMAPEMANGPVEKVDRRSDVYLLGTLLFEILTGSPPHPQKTIRECLRAAAQNEIAPSGESGMLMDIAMQAMSRSREARYQTAADFQDAVREYFAHIESNSLAEQGQEFLSGARESDDHEVYSKAIFAFEQAHELWLGNEAAIRGASDARLAYAESALRKKDYDLCGSVLDMEDLTHTELRLDLFEELAEKQRREVEHTQRMNRIRIVSRGLLASVLATVVIAFFWINSERNSALMAKQDEARERKRADREAETATAIAHEVRRNLKVIRQKAYAHRISLTEREWSAGRIDRVRDLLDACPTDLRQWEWYYMSRLCNTRHRIVNAHVDGVLAMSVLPGGTQVVTGGRDHTTALWDMATGTARFRVQDHDWDVTVVAASPDGAKFASGGSDGSVKVYDRLSGELLQELHVRRPVTCLTWLHDGSQIILGTGDIRTGFGEVRQLDAASLQTIDELWDATAVSALALSPDDRTLVIAGPDEGVQILSIDGSFEPHELTDGSKPARALAFSPAGDLLAIANDGHAVNLFDVRNGSTKGRLMGTGLPLASLAWSPDGEYIAAGSEDGLIYLWHTVSQQNLGTFRGHSATVTALGFASADLLISVSDDGTIGSWNTQQQDGVVVLLESPFPVYDLQVDSTARHVTAAHGNRFTLLELDSGAVIAGNESGEGQVWTTAVSADGQYTAWSGVDGHLHMMSHPWKSAEAVLADVNDILKIRFNTQGTRIATAGTEGVLHVWDTTSLEEQSARRISSLEITDVAWNLTGERIATVARDGVLRIHSLENQTSDREIHTGDDLLHCIAWSQNQIATAGSDAVVRIWNPADGTLIRELHSHTAAIHCLAFNEDGSRLVSGGRDQRLRVWDTRSGDVLVTLAGHESTVLSVAWNSATRHLLSGDEAGRIFRWLAE